MTWVKTRVHSNTSAFNFDKKQITTAESKFAGLQQTKKNQPIGGLDVVVSMSTIPLSSSVFLITFSSTDKGLFRIEIC